MVDAIYIGLNFTWDTINYIPDTYIKIKNRYSHTAIIRGSRGYWISGQKTADYRDPRIIKAASNFPQACSSWNFALKENVPAVISIIHSHLYEWLEQYKHLHITFHLYLFKFKAESKYFPRALSYDNTKITNLWFDMIPNHEFSAMQKQRRGRTQRARRPDCVWQANGQQQHYMDGITANCHYGNSFRRTFELGKLPKRSEVAEMIR